jgi:glycosyltransferase involved in cell wall biosynthesis
MDGVVILSIFDWWYHSHGHSDFQLARAFAAEKLPVLFVNSIGMRLPRRGTATAPLRRIGRKLRSMARVLRFPEPGLELAVATPIALPFYTGVLARLNMRAVELQIRRCMAFMRIKHPLVIITVPTFAPVALALPRRALFYNRSDLHSAFSGADKHMLRSYENSLFHRSDIVLYASQQLFQSEADRVKRAVWIGHGIDAALFTPEGRIAPEIDKLPGPRVGFFGDLRARSVDFDLIAEVAQLCPEVHFVLGGTQLDDLRSLRSLGNVHILAACPHQEMPARWRGLDAAILPYRLSSWMMAGEPIKLNEILAMGLPAVGTPLPSLLQRAEAIDIASDAKSFAEAIHKLIEARPSDVLAERTRRRAAFDHRDWASLAQTIVDLGHSLRMPLETGLPLGESDGIRAAV